MTDHIKVKDRTGADLDIAAKELAGVQHPLNILCDETGTPYTPLTNAQLRAAAVPVSISALPLPAGAATAAGLASVVSALGSPLQAGGTVALDAPTLAALESISTGGLTDAELRATPLPVIGTFWQATQPVSFTWAGLTDAQLRAAAVPISVASLPLPAGAATAAGVASIVSTLGSPLQAGGAVSVSNFPVTQPVSFTWAGLTDAQLRAAAVPVSVASVPLPAGAASEATLEAARVLLALLSTIVSSHDDVAADGHAGVPMLVRRRDSDVEPVVADGDFTFFNIDEEGRLKVASKPASYPDITGSINAVQASISTPVVGGTVSGDVSRASNVMAFCTGIFAGINCTFEGSLEATGDYNWFAVQAVRTNANTIELSTGALSGQPAYAWELSVNALSRLRVRCTARTNGTQNWLFKQGTYATEPIPAAQVSGTQPVSGTVSLGAATARTGFVAGAGIWYDDTATALGASATFTGTSRDATVTATATAFANAATYAKEIRASAESDVTGTLWLEVSRDNTNWHRVKSTPTAAVSGGGFYAEIIHRPSWRYWRTGFTNGAGAQTRLSVGTVAIGV